MLQILFLAVVQGIAEFLPISSSGHLVVLGALTGKLSESPTLEIILHAGTLGSILVIYWRRILDLLFSDRRVIGMLIVGTIPAVIVGLTIKKNFEWLMRSPLLAGSMLIVTGIFLVLLGRLKPRDGEYQKMSLLAAFGVGCFQAFAILPGISRSGSTILGARLLGVKNEDSVTFSFLLAIPAICGAVVLELKDFIEARQLSAAMQADSADVAFSPTALAIGAVVSFLVGIIALKWLIGWSRLDRLHWFAWWCIPAGVVAIAVSLGGVVSP
ncbi:bacitracin resistance protein (BacA) [Rhodopirellula maiorica SM1]|uniref:Undecaprenyl-diphosphatase n=1 Tax=Rhodopirellula maiorica SM1 TaxID=1265738 RepID=M5RXF2_9BACT|nr:undecaprenyl-diphosphate phosphatase [Rhodopirellula maiorica]EMI20087.1 bacitracin resistance protein (BacA) [Rhodopirellula maiorica SM1]